MMQARRAIGSTSSRVLTPSGAHCANVLELVEYGRPIVVEKPMALRLEDADRMIEACDAHGVKLFVVHQNRYNPPIVKAREALEQGRFGRLVLGTVRLRWTRDQAYYDSESWRGTWAHDGGVFMNQAAHHIDMLTWFMGNVESVRSMAATRLVKIECEDTGVAVMRFNSGALGVLEATTATRPKDLEGSISILGEKGSVVIGGFFMNELVTWNFADKQPERRRWCSRQYGKNPPDFGYNHGEYLRGRDRVDSDQEGGARRRARRPPVAGADHGALRIDRDQQRRSASLPAEEVPTGDGVMSTYMHLRERHARRRRRSSRTSASSARRRAAPRDGELADDDRRRRGDPLAHRHLRRQRHRPELPDRQQSQHPRIESRSATTSASARCRSSSTTWRSANNVRIHTQVFIPEFSVLEEGCWIGPNVVLTNAKYPLSPGVEGPAGGPGDPQGRQDRRQRDAPARRRHRRKRPRRRRLRRRRTTCRRVRWWSATRRASFARSRNCPTRRSYSITSTSSVIRRNARELTCRHSRRR